MLATRPDTDTIAITRTFDGIEMAAHRVIEQIGGMDSVLRGATIAILKPNFVAGRSAETGSTTSFALLKAVAMLFNRRVPLSTGADLTNDDKTLECRRTADS